MSQTEPQEPGAVPATANARKEWEWFWRIVAGLMSDVATRQMQEARQDEQSRGERLKLSTEITTPLVERKGIPK